MSDVIQKIKKKLENGYYNTHNGAGTQDIKKLIEVFTALSDYTHSLQHLSLVMIEVIRKSPTEPEEAVKLLELSQESNQKMKRFTEVVELIDEKNFN
jgi:hypothetical protein